MVVVDMTGQIGVLAVPPTSAIQRGIAWVTNSDAYHVVVAVSDTECVGAEPGGVLINNLHTWPGMIWSHFDYTTAAAERVARFAYSKLGEPYNWLADGMITIECLAGFDFPRCIEHIASRGDRWECAQLAYASLLTAGIDPFTGRETGMVYPGMFERFFQRKGWWVDR